MALYSYWLIWFLVAVVVLVAVTIGAVLWVYRRSEWEYKRQRNKRKELCVLFLLQVSAAFLGVLTAHFLALFLDQYAEIADLKASMQSQILASENQVADLLNRVREAGALYQDPPVRSDPSVEQLAYRPSMQQYLEVLTPYLALSGDLLTRLPDTVNRRDHPVAQRIVLVRALIVDHRHVKALLTLGIRRLDGEIDRGSLATMVGELNAERNSVIRPLLIEGGHFPGTVRLPPPN